MKNFIEDALKEFHHVVFPTPAETKKYFQIVLAFIVIFGLFLYILGSSLSSGLYAIKAVVKPLAPQSQSTAPTGTKSDLKFNTGAVKSDSSGLTLPKVTIPPTTTTGAAK